MTASDHHGAIPYSECESPYARAYNAKLGELIAAGRHRDDAAGEARRYANSAISPEEAARNRQVVDSLGITYGAPSAPVSLSSVSTSPGDDVLKTEEVGAVDWNAVLRDLNANRR